MTGTELLNNGHVPKNLCYCLMNAEHAFYTKDKELLNDGSTEIGALGEWTLVFRFGHYLQNKLNEYPEYRTLALDCEYNKHEYNQKMDIEKQKVIRPDLCLHERRTNEHNLLVIEFKREGRGDDRNKLCMLTDFLTGDPQSDKSRYGYRFGLSIIFQKDEFDYDLYQGGALVTISNTIH